MGNFKDFIKRVAKKDGPFTGTGRTIGDSNAAITTSKPSDKSTSTPATTLTKPTSSTAVTEQAPVSKEKPNGKSSKSEPDPEIVRAQMRAQAVKALENRVGIKAPKGSLARKMEVDNSKTTKTLAAEAAAWNLRHRDVDKVSDDVCGR